MRYCVTAGKRKHLCSLCHRCTSWEFCLHKPSHYKSDFPLWDARLHRVSIEEAINRTSKHYPTVGGRGLKLLLGKMTHFKRLLVITQPLFSTCPWRPRLRLRSSLFADRLAALVVGEVMRACPSDKPDNKIRNPTVRSPGQARDRHWACRKLERKIICTNFRAFKLTIRD